MRALSASELLEVWERGLAQTPLERALTLLGAACPEESPGALAGLHIGGRDARLLTLREWTFGPQLTSLADCPSCGERLELNLSASDLRVETGDARAETLTASAAGYDVSFRLPNSYDLAAVAERAGEDAAGRAGEEAAAARRLLLERCLVEARHEDERVGAGQLPEEVSGAVAAAMAEADPQADMQLALKCPACGADWRAPFDIESFFWAEINAWAQRVLSEVHALASAYGWHESDILRMSAWRRQFYLNLVSG